MSAATLIRVAILLSMALLVIALGLRSAEGDASYLFRRPGLLWRSVVAMNVLMPAIVILLVLALRLKPAVSVALVALSVSPVPPFLPGKQLKLTRREGYVYGLLVASAVLSLVLVPLTTAILEYWGIRREHAGAMGSVSFATVARIIGATVLLPLALGMLMRRRWPELARRVAAPATTAGSILLVVAFLPVLLSEWPAIRSLLGDGTLLAIAAFTAVGLCIGHALGGPDPRDRTVLALATASRHPAVALAVAAALFPQQRLAPAAVLLALLVGILASIPYSSRRGKLLQQAAAAKQPTVT